MIPTNRCSLTSRNKPTRMLLMRKRCSTFCMLIYIIKKNLSNVLATITRFIIFAYHWIQWINCCIVMQNCMFIGTFFFIQSNMLQNLTTCNSTQLMAGPWQIFKAAGVSAFFSCAVSSCWSIKYASEQSENVWFSEAYFSEWNSSSCSTNPWTGSKHGRNEGIRFSSLESRQEEMQEH